MSFRNAFGIYQILERLLKASDKPLTCVELYDSPEVRAHTRDVNHVSDYLGHMWRRKLLSRSPSQGIGAARWAYAWKDPNLGSPVARVTAPRLQVLSTKDAEQRAKLFEQAAALRPPVPTANSQSLINRPHLRVSEAGDSIMIELDRLIITIMTK